MTKNETYGLDSQFLRRIEIWFIQLEWLSRSSGSQDLRFESRRCFVCLASNPGLGRHP